MRCRAWEGVEVGDVVPDATRDKAIGGVPDAGGARGVDVESGQLLPGGGGGGGGGEAGEEGGEGFRVRDVGGAVCCLLVLVCCGWWYREKGVYGRD